jgi:hypothetical protein
MARRLHEKLAAVPEPPPGAPRGPGKPVSLPGRRIAIDFSELNIDDEGAADLAVAMMNVFDCERGAIGEVLLHTNQIGDAGAAALAPALVHLGSQAPPIPGMNPWNETYCRLHTVTLSNNQIGDAGAISLASLFEARRGHNPDIFFSGGKFDLSANLIGDAGGYVLAHAMLETARQPQDPHAQTPACANKRNTTALDFRLDHNKISAGMQDRIQRQLGHSRHKLGEDPAAQHWMRGTIGEIHL